MNEIIYLNEAVECNQSFSDGEIALLLMVVGIVCFIVGKFMGGKNGK